MESHPCELGIMISTENHLAKLLFLALVTG